MNQEKTRKKRILYVQITPGIGGGIMNGLFPVVAGLNRDHYEPLVLFYWPNSYQKRFESLGVKTIVFDKPKSWRHPAPVAQLQKNGVVKSLQQGNGRGSKFYYALGSYVRLSYYLPQTLRLARLIKANEIDLVHLYNSHTHHGREVVLAAKLAGVPCACYLQGFTEFQTIDRQIARLVDRFVYCSDAVGKHFETKGGAAPHQGCTIHPGVVDVAKWSGPFDTLAVRHELGWSEQDFIVGNVGRLEHWKGQHIFLGALAEVKREVPNIKGLLVGDPPKVTPDRHPEQSPTDYYEKLLALTEKLELSENVYFTGFRRDVPQLVTAMDVLVHSSILPEPFGIVVAEGMITGRPVITVNVGGMPEMVEHGVTGLVVPPGDQQTLANAILSLYQDRKMARRLAMAGQHRAKTYLTEQRYIDEMHTLYQHILN